MSAIKPSTAATRSKLVKLHGIGAANLGPTTWAEVRGILIGGTSGKRHRTANEGIQLCRNRVDAVFITNEGPSSGQKEKTT